MELETHCYRRHTCTCATKFLHHLGTGCCLPKITFRTKIGGGLARGGSKNLGPLRISATVEAITTSNLVHNLGLGLAYEKTTFSTKIGGGLSQGSIQKIGTPYLFLQPLKLATSNLVHNLGLGLAYQKKQRLGPQLAVVWARGASEKIWDPLFIYATVEARD